MYFPYLRGRQFELIAVRELVERRLIGNKIFPIIEPLKPTSTLVRTLETMKQYEQKYALVMNPEVGEFVIKLKEQKNEHNQIADDIVKQANSDCVTKAYLMNKYTRKLLQRRSDLEDLMIIHSNEDFVEQHLQLYSGFEPKFTLVQGNRQLIRKSEKSKVIFGDKFLKAQRNVDYLKVQDQFFSEEHLYFSEDGYQGFSDYSIVGGSFVEAGFAPLAVAIHIVYFDKELKLRVRHFVSDSNDDINDPAGKFGEALKKLVDWVEKEEPVITYGLKKFIECYDLGKYPGLGTVKKFSIMHHLELMNKYLEGEITCE